MKYKKGEKKKVNSMSLNNYNPTRMKMYEGMDAQIHFLTRALGES
jgi:hypothetical protein